MKSVLVVIDVQNHFANERTSSLPEKIANHIGENSYDFIVFTKFINKEGSNWFRLLNWQKMTSSPEIDIHPTLVRFTKTENVFEKTSYSIFKNPKFVSFIEKNNITRFFFCGLDVDSCILASAFEAFDLGYEVKVLEKLSASHSGDEFRQAGLRIIGKDIQK